MQADEHNYGEIPSSFEGQGQALPIWFFCKVDKGEGRQSESKQEVCEEIRQGFQEVEFWKEGQGSPLVQKDRFRERVQY